MKQGRSGDQLSCLETGFPVCEVRQIGRSIELPVTWSSFTGPVQVRNGHYGRLREKTVRSTNSRESFETEMRVDRESKFETYQHVGDGDQQV